MLVQPLAPPVFDAHHYCTVLSTRISIGANVFLVPPLSARATMGDDANRVPYWQRASLADCQRTCLLLEACRFGTFIHEGQQCWLASHSRAFREGAAAHVVQQASSRMMAWQCGEGVRCVSFVRRALPKRSAPHQRRARLVAQLRTALELAREQAKLVMGSALWQGRGQLDWYGGSGGTVSQGAGVGAAVARALVALRSNVPCKAVAPYMRAGGVVTTCHVVSPAAVAPRVVRTTLGAPLRATRLAAHTRAPAVSPAPLRSKSRVRFGKCAPGSYLAYGKCTACQPGRYQQFEGFSSCKACPAGQFTEVSGGATRCMLCKNAAMQRRIPACVVQQRRRRSRRPPRIFTRRPAPHVLHGGTLSLMFRIPIATSAGGGVGAVGRAQRSSLSKALVAALTGAKALAAPVPVSVVSVWQSQPYAPVIVAVHAQLPLGARAPGTLVALVCDPLFAALLRVEVRARGLAAPEQRHWRVGIHRDGLPTSVCAAPQPGAARRAAKALANLKSSMRHKNRAAASSGSASVVSTPAFSNVQLAGLVALLSLGGLVTLFRTQQISEQRELQAYAEMAGHSATVPAVAKKTICAANNRKQRVPAAARSATHTYTHTCMRTQTPMPVHAVTPIPASYNSFVSQTASLAFTEEDMI
jgi:hypothetical protein